MVEVRGRGYGCLIVCSAGRLGGRTRGRSEASPTKYGAEECEGGIREEQLKPEAVGREQTTPSSIAPQAPLRGRQGQGNRDVAGGRGPPRW